MVRAAVHEEIVINLEFAFVLGKVLNLGVCWTTGLIEHRFGILGDPENAEIAPARVQQIAVAVRKEISKEQQPGDTDGKADRPREHEKTHNDRDAINRQQIN